MKKKINERLTNIISRSPIGQPLKEQRDSDVKNLEMKTLRYQKIAPIVKLNMDSFLKLKSEFDNLVSKIKIPGSET
ncbi:CLUMA_CG021318, isoform A [Clunio marinus]|uniref:CLUMA_CG021318, isoform A n=1 Tax=Clunio marinus TaxID=568069 RepID=A0A1J1J8H5_9DIPT|nr:CLUMA_CG021318, isoform A [Clunio marinus]